MTRAIEGGETRCEVLCHAEMTRASSHFVAELDQSRQPARHCAFAGVRHRLHVQIEIARGVEAALGGGVDQRLDCDPLHLTRQAASLQGYSRRSENVVSQRTTIDTRKSN